MDRFALVLLVLAAACAPSRPAAGGPSNGEGPAVAPLRLCIRNETVGYGSLIANAGPIRFNVLAGQEQCRNVSDTGPGIQLTAVTTGGGVLGPLSYSATLRPAGSQCWRWNLTNTASSSLDLEPCD